MTTAKMVADYIKSRLDVTGEMQLQKLLYYSQAWSLTWDGAPLFDDRIEAWRLGPVVASVWRDQSPDGAELTEDQRAIVDAVVAHYGRSYGNQLSHLTHKESPWRMVWDRCADDDGRCSDEITHSSMLREYTRQSMAGVGPSAPSGRASTPLPDSVVAATTERNKRRWAEALALLAQ